MEFSRSVCFIVCLNSCDTGTLPPPKKNKTLFGMPKAALDDFYYQTAFKVKTKYNI